VASVSSTGRSEAEGGREPARAGERRGERETAAGGPYPLVWAVGAACISSGIDGNGVDTQELVVWRKMMEEEVGWAKVGLDREMRGGGLGWKWPKARRVYFFPSKLFSISVFQSPLLFYKKSLQTQNFLRNSIHSPS
jgi:hypothetical protein